MAGKYIIDKNFCSKYFTKKELYKARQGWNENIFHFEKKHLQQKFRKNSGNKMLFYSAKIPFYSSKIKALHALQKLNNN